MTVTTEVAVREGGALAVQAGQTHWSEQQLAVLQSIGIKPEVTEAELDAFLHECQQRKLDPFSKQIYLIGRYDKKEQRDVYRSQTGIDGFRVIAHRAAREAREPIAYEDTQWCGFDGEWRDVWLFANPPSAAKVVVLRNGERFPATATLAEYAATYPDGNPLPMWKRMPATMLAKCAEALALRKAFPDDLSGIYTAEEMGQADNAVSVPQGRPERPAQRHSGPAADDQWSQTAPVPADDIADAEVVGAEPTSVPMATKGHRANLVMAFTEKGITDRAARLKHTSAFLGRNVPSFTTLTADDYQRLRKALRGGWPNIDPSMGSGPEPGEYDVPAVTGEVFDVVAKFIADAPDMTALAEAGADIVAERDRGNLTPTEVRQLREMWSARKRILDPPPVMAGASA